jgi:hypothetical protein
MGYLYTAACTLSVYLRETRVFQGCNPVVVMVPSTAEKLVPMSEKIYNNGADFHTSPTWALVPFPATQSSFDV